MSEQTIEQLKAQLAAKEGELIKEKYKHEVDILNGKLDLLEAKITPICADTSDHEERLRIIEKSINRYDFLFGGATLMSLVAIIKTIFFP